MRRLKLTGEACLDERKFDMSRLWTGRWPGRTPINNAYWRFRRVWQAKPSQLSLKLVAIWGMSV